MIYSHLLSHSNCVIVDVFSVSFRIELKCTSDNKKKEEIKRDKRNNSFPQAKCIRKNILFLDLIASYDDHC